MQKMTLNDLLATGSLWGEIQKVNNFDFIDDYGVDVLDMMTAEFYGLRLLYHTVTDRTLTDVAKMLVALHGEKWQTLINVGINGIDNLGGTNRTVTETITENETTDNNSEMLGKVSAYNTTDLMVKDGNVNSGSANKENTKTRTKADTGYSIRSAFYNLSLLDKNNIMMVALKDTANFTTLSIY